MDCWCLVADEKQEANQQYTVSFPVFGAPGYRATIQAGQMIVARPDGTTVYAPDPGTPEQAISIVASKDAEHERLHREETAALLLDDIDVFLKLQASRMNAQMELRVAARGGAIGAAFRGSRR